MDLMEPLDKKPHRLVYECFRREQNIKTYKVACNKSTSDYN